MNEMMQFMEELKELVHKGEQMVQHMQGGNLGERRYSHMGMRDNQGYPMSTGNWNQRWGGHPMQGQFTPQGGYPPQYPDMNPLMFM